MRHIDVQLRTLGCYFALTSAHGSRPPDLIARKSSQVKGCTNTQQ